MSGGDDGGPLRAFAEAERLVYQPAEELGRGGRLHGVHGVCRGVEVDAGPFVRAGSRYLDRHGTPPPLEVRVRGRAIHPTEDTLCLWPNGVLTRLARLLGAPSWVSGDARFDAAYLVETTSGALADAIVDAEQRERVVALGAFEFLSLEGGEVELVLGPAPQDEARLRAGLAIVVAAAHVLPPPPTLPYR
ncbi:MAG: hypothetical protein JNL38_03455 [Myxococcales bacterium]|nr:hypothetical protein [Myxococcales bacterium]